MCLYISTTAHMSSVHKLGFHECLEEKCKYLFLKQKHSISFIIKEQGQQTTTTHTSHQISLSHHIKQTTNTTYYTAPHKYMLTTASIIDALLLYPLRIRLSNLLQHVLLVLVREALHWQALFRLTPVVPQ